jgi:hypothetical protein
MVGRLGLDDRLAPDAGVAGDPGGLTVLAMRGYQ